MTTSRVGNVIPTRNRVRYPPTVPPWTVWCTYIVIHLLLLTVQSAVTQKSYGKDSSVFQHLVIDESTEDIYIGGTNIIVHLDSNLDESNRNSLSTGPVIDSKDCNVGSSCPDGELTDNVNKVLVINPTNNKLIFCGSTLQGTCQLTDLADVKNNQSYASNDDTVYVAANDADKSTVAFIAPGPGNENVLYVGGTYVAGTTRKNVPAVSSRKLGSSPNTFMYAYKKSFGGGTYLKLDKQDYFITYVHGFSESGFSYFLTVQPDVYRVPASSNYVSKIVQVCQNDQFYRSYVEMELKCGDNNIIQAATTVKPGRKLAQSLGVTIYDTVLIGVFSKGSPGELTGSAVCVYKIEDIRQKFTDNIQKCFQATSGWTLGAQFYQNDVSCRAMSTPIGVDYCGSSSSNTPLAGQIVLSANPAYTSTRLATAITAINVTGQHTVVFVGTNDGKLEKILVDSRDTGTQFELTDISANKVLPDMHFDKSKNNIYILTQSKVYRLPVESCDDYKDCHACKNAKNPYCGWCSLEAKCTQKRHCDKVHLGNRWLPYQQAECVAVTSVSPSTAPINMATMVTVASRILPDLETGREYQCVFGDAGQSDTPPVTSGTRNGNHIECSTPDSQYLPDIGTDGDNMQLDLNVRSTEKNINFLKSKFTFYNCGHWDSCSTCTSSNWGCRWCLHSNQCVANGEGCRVASTVLQSTQSCPRLIVPSKEILIPADVDDFVIDLPASRLPTPAGNQEGYECKIGTERVPAVRVSDSALRCSAHKYVYGADTEHITATVTAVWNHDFAIESSSEITATIYKCPVMGRDCSMCQSVHVNSPQYNCTWCRQGSCLHHEQCPVTERVTGCPNPIIANVYPTSTTLRGGSNVTILGTNLGASRNNVVRVTIAGKECKINGYEVSKMIRCEVQGQSNEGSGKVEVEIDGTKSNTRWNGEFHFRKPSVRSVSPGLGPKSGGTELTIRGVKLDTGANIEVTLNDTVCNVNRSLVTDGQILCRTTRVSEPLNLTQLTVKFDGNAKRLNVDYRYTPDPNITDIAPLATFISGGRLITVKGSYLDTVQQPKMFLRIGVWESAHVLCTIVSNSQLRCPTPSSVGSNKQRRRRRRRRRNSQVPYSLGFDMDGVTSVVNVSAGFPGVDSSMQVYPDPIYETWDNQKPFKGENIVLNGQGLDKGCTESEIEVRIGMEKWQVTSLTTTKLVVQPPNKKSQFKPGEVAPVKVKVGAFEKQLGQVQYERPELYFPNEAIIGIAAGGFILIMIIIIILIVYKRKSTEADRQYKKMQIQLDTLESNVRNECKQAFAELQTEVSDLTSNMHTSGIPFWDYKSYTFKVLFPSHSDHPVLHNTLDVKHSRIGSYDIGLQQFNQLLNNKPFLLIFIRTMEAQKNFSIRDKSLVASLVMIALQDKMDYATEILKALLNELIDRSVEKKHPKLMLRRTESVVEKMLTNWLSVAMYGHLKRHAGKSLFMLFHAIKHQTEKGPVDAIVSEARYCLSEDRLLREKIDHHTLTINLVSDSSTEVCSCKMLDIDTITQAKKKALDALYKNTAYSRRPTVYDVDLEWRNGRSGHLPLQDEDVTTQTINGWKKVNSLAHYHIPDGATLALIPRREKNEFVNKVHGMVEISAPFPLMTKEDGCKVWHLVKHDDSVYQSRTQKVISEIFLTRLLATKVTLQEFIDELFMQILKVDNNLPPAIKYLFDFLDSAARRHNILDPDVVHTWKSNSLPLRFWVNLIKNPDFVFDVHKPQLVDSCLSAIAQTFMDSCSTSEHKLGMHSPSNKLLFARDIPRYRQWVNRYYREVAEMPPVAEKEMAQAMADLSRQNGIDFNVSCSLRELYTYAKNYSFELLEALDDDPSAKKMNLSARFEQVSQAIEGTRLHH